MKIGILGAPGVGKSKFAGELDVELSKRGYDPFLVVDNYVTDLREDTGLEYGGFGNFVDDMQVVFKRREAELIYGKSSSTITVGTVLDSVIHNFIRTDEMSRTRDEIRLNSERLKAIAATFGLLYTETWDYDYAFFLSSNDTYGRALFDLIVTYRAPILSFNPEVPDDEKASVAANAVKSLEETPLTPTYESGVRGGSEDGEPDGDSSEPVPDVPEQRGTPDES